MRAWCSNRGRARYFLEGDLLDSQGGDAGPPPINGKYSSPPNRQTSRQEGESKQGQWQRAACACTTGVDRGMQPRHARHARRTQRAQYFLEGDCCKSASRGREAPLGGQYSSPPAGVASASEACSTHSTHSWRRPWAAAGDSGGGAKAVHAGGVQQASSTAPAPRKRGAQVKWLTFLRHGCGVGLNSNCKFRVLIIALALVQLVDNAPGCMPAAPPPTPGDTSPPRDAHPPTHPRPSSAHKPSAFAQHPPVAQQLVQVAGELGVQALVAADHLVAKSEACGKEGGRGGGPGAARAA